MALKKDDREIWFDEKHKERVSDSSQPACSVFRICEHCNKEYEVPLGRAGNASKDWICNFTDCPHCGKRDDVWILIRPNSGITGK